MMCFEWNLPSNDKEKMKLVAKCFQLNGIFVSFDVYISCFVSSMSKSTWNVFLFEFFFLLYFGVIQHFGFYLNSTDYSSMLSSTWKGNNNREQKKHWKNPFPIEMWKLNSLFAIALRFFPFLSYFLINLTTDFGSVILALNKMNNYL